MPEVRQYQTMPKSSYLFLRSTSESENMSKKYQTAELLSSYYGRSYELMWLKMKYIS